MSPSPIDNLRLRRAYDLIADKLARVEEELLLHFRSPIPTIDRIGTYLAQGGGKVTKNEYWGLKSLSYRIKKNRKAHYSLLNIDAPAAAVAEMERQMRINEDILRFMTVRVDELEEGPSAMMQKREERSDRGDRGFGDRPRGGFGDRDRGSRSFGDREDRGPRLVGAVEL